MGAESSADLVEWLGVGIALCAAGASIVFSFFAGRHSKQSLENSKQSIETERLAIRISENALKVEQENAHNALLGEIRDWAARSVHALSRACHLAEIDPTRLPEGEYFFKRLDILTELSSLIDIGRWFYPNTSKETYGDWKEESFQGFKQPALDQLVLAYKGLRKFNYLEQADNREHGQKIVTCKRAFVSHVSSRLEILEAPDEQLL
ncbi:MULTISPECIES: hypothetical protein [unclassified Roseovarius]|uniref:hypothetical protein n=1 Tax=unclassified Roseovarius TaxID=2614913 RepID=UPI00273D927B|nr:MULTISPECIES: hypothetical protein [unclassified Roseovarius]